jgi:hypothetical protein
MTSKLRQKMKVMESDNLTTLSEIARLVV